MALTPETELGNIFFTEFVKLADANVDAPAKSFIGAWRCKSSSGAGTRIVSPFWNLPFSSMLEECMAAGTLVDTLWSTCCKRLDVFDVPSHPKKKKKMWIFSLAPEDEPITVNSKLGTIGRQFAALAFISELRKLLLRKRRMTYETKQFTLAGRVKGKLLISPTVRKHIVRGRLDLLDCSIPTRTEDNRVNQVLRYTLQLCKNSIRTMSGEHLPTSWCWATFCEDVLAGVTEISSTRDADYVPHGLTGFYKEHGNLLALAKVIKINHQECSQADKASVKTVPFLLNTWFVFERWVTARAQRAAEAIGWSLTFPQKEEPKLGDGFISFAPDMVFTKSGKDPKVRILDAKYKKFWQEERCPNYDTDPKSDYQEFRHDLHQILAYQSVFSAERVGIIFPSSGAEKKRDSLQPHPVGKNPLLWTLAVDPKCHNVEYLITEFLKES